VTRLAPDKAGPVRRAVKGSVYDPVSRTLRRGRMDLPARGPVAVCCAGTSDIPVCEEAAVTLDVMGIEAIRVYDVGVAGLHRLLARRDDLLRARAVIVAAGMEGALPSVVGGLTGVPLVAVPTSVGYGASFGGLAALLAMLNSCAPGVTVVNIDNGYGAGVFAARVERAAR
jgi:NCAIR mutase (PurE)-related protein